jgi:V/A-type H+-transporting ATPase subunit C
MSTRVYPKANTLVRVRETRLLGKEQWHALLQARSYEAALALLADWGWLAGGAQERAGANKLVNHQLAVLLAWLSDIAPDARLTALFTLRYDLNNLKVLFREEAGEKVDPTLWLDAGGATREQLLLQTRTKNTPFGELYEAFRKSWEEHGSWQRLGLLGERFYYARLAALAKELGEPQIQRFVEVLTDYHNLSLLLRRREEELPSPEADSLPGGTLTPSALGDGPALSKTPYGEALARPELFETLKDNHLMRLAIKTKLEAFGLAPICGYVFAAVTELKNLRLVLVAKENGLPMEKVAERMRILYEL